MSALSLKDNEMPVSNAPSKKKKGKKFKAPIVEAEAPFAEIPPTPVM